VVVVAEVFSAQARAAAAMAVGEDVAALELPGCFGCVLHGVSPTGTYLCKVFKREEMSPDFRFPSCRTLRLNAKARLLAGPFSIYFYFIELTQTKMPVLAGLFLACR
jgi:hypothetical protein